LIGAELSKRSTRNNKKGMTSFLVIFLLVVAIGFGVLDSTSVANLRDYFSKKHPQEWKSFNQSRARAFVPGRGQQPWGWNMGALSRFVKTSSAVSNDSTLTHQIRRIQRFRICAVSIMATIFVLLIISK
jgi:hypothetical protein